MKNAFTLLAKRLRVHASERRQSLTDDLIAQTFDELADQLDQIPASALTPLSSAPDPIASHLEAHSQDHLAREIPNPVNPVNPVLSSS